MPLSLANSVCAPSIPTFLMRACCPDWSEKGLPGLRFPYRDKVAAVAGKSPLSVCAPRSPRRHGVLRRRRSRAVVKLERVSILNDMNNRQVKARSMGDPHTLVLEREPDDTETNTDEASSKGRRRIEVVGKDIDLEEEMSLVRERGGFGTKKRKKPRETRMKLDALQSQTAHSEDTESRAALVTKEVQLRSEGDAANLAESDNGSCEELFSVVREKVLAAHLTKNSSVSCVDQLQIGSEPSDVPTKRSSLNRKPSINEESRNTLSFESSSSWNEAEALRMERIENASKSSTSKSELHVRRNPSPVVIKKPVSVSRPIYAPNNISEEETTGNTDSFSTISDSDEEGLASDVVGFHIQRKDLRNLDLTTGLKALRCLISGKKTEAAKDLAKQLYEQYPGDTDVLVEYAYVERQRGDLVAAGALYSQAITAFEDQKNLGYDYVRALQALGCIEAHARNAKRARVLFMESIHAARQAERRFPDMINGAAVYGLHAWARLEEQLGNWSKAQELLARAAEIQPGNAVVHQSRALLEARAHNWGAARHHFRLAVEAAPKDVKCWHAWAIFEGSQGKRQKMRQLFHRALEVDPTSVHSLQAWAYQETLVGTLESKEKARSLLHRCTQIEPENLFSWQAWAVMEHASGNYDKARELFEKCLGVNSSCVACLQAFAKMERNLGNLGAAQRLLRKALRVEPENAAVLMEAAFVEKGLGNAELAEKLFILAGMADKRKSRVRNQMFVSRKASMASKGHWRVRADRKNKLKDRVDVNMAKQASSHLKQGGKARSQQPWASSVLGA